MSQERRRTIRLDARLTTLFTIVETGRVRRALTQNVGGLGLAFTGEELFPPGTRLDVELQLPDRATPLAFGAEVIWSQPTGEPHKSYEDPVVRTGTKFLDVDAKQMALIRQYVALNAPPTFSDR